MSETLAIEQRLRRFAAGPDDADWQDVLRRADLTPRRRPHLTRRSVVAAVVIAAVALALPALALSGVLSSLLGFSNQGTPVPEQGATLQHALQVTSAKPGSLVLLGVHEGIGVYAARSKKDDHLCFYWGGGGLPPTGKDLNLSGGCFLAANGMLPRRLWNAPFPSRARPVFDMSSAWPLGLRMTPPEIHAFAFAQLVGVAADPVRTIQVLALSDCHPVVTLPVIENVYVDAHPPAVDEAYLVARNADGRVLWHSVPLAPGAPACGLGPIR